MDGNTRLKNITSLPIFTTTLLLAILLLILFNFNIDVFRAGAAPGEVYGEGTPGYIARWIDPPPPVITNVTFTEPDYCSSPGGSFEWTYSGFSIPQDGFRIQIDDKSNFSDCPGVNCAYDETCRASLGCSYGSGVDGPNYRAFSAVLPWDKTLYARVMVWNATGLASSWRTLDNCFNGPSSSGCNGTNRWKTPRHAYPNVSGSPSTSCTSSGYDFSWTPCLPGVGTEVSFTDHTDFDADSSGGQWRWMFSDGKPNSALQNPLHTFDFEGVYSVVEGVRDNATGGFYCEVTKNVRIQKPIPKWREIAPR